MKINKLQSIVFSPCGGTLKVAEAISKGIPLEQNMADLTRPGARPDSLLCGPDDLAVIAFPVYFGYLPAKITQNLFNTISGDATATVLVAVYGNREFEGALVEMAELARKRGFRPVAAVAAVAEHSMNPEIATGRPDRMDLGLLADFGSNIFNRLSAQPDLEAFDFQAPGAPPKHPYGPRIKPSAAPEICTSCGTCVDACPMSAIPQDAPSDTEDGCIGCMACIKVCPVTARTLQAPNLNEKLAMLKSMTAERKDALFFF